jgi:hypothetical protein
MSPAKIFSHFIALSKYQYGDEMQGIIEGGEPPGCKNAFFF